LEAEEAKDGETLTTVKITMKVVVRIFTSTVEQYDVRIVMGLAECRVYIYLVQL